MFITYDTITLKMFIDIANTGNVSQLCVRGKASQVELAKHWEEIVKLNLDHAEDSTYDMHLENLQQLGNFMSLHTRVKAMLMVLHYQIDDEYIEELKQLGYKIEVSKTPEQNGRKAYAESLHNAMRKSENLVSKLTSKYKEILSLTKEVEESKVTLGALLAQLSFALGANGIVVPLEENILLSQFNEYKKLVKQIKSNGQRNKQAGHNI